MKDGVYVGGRPPYGYVRSSDNKHKLIIDTSAAETVKQIFTWAADGISVFEIVRKLNASNISSPIAYYSLTNSAYKTHEAITSLWHPRTVKRILENEIYLGRLTQGKTKKIGFSRRQAPSHEWISVDRIHEAIISVEMFKTVQALNAKSQDVAQTKPKTTYTTNIFKGKIYCAHCGGRLERRKKHDKNSYYCVANRIVLDFCVGNRIGEEDINFAVREQLLQYRNMIRGDDHNTTPDFAAISSELQFVEMELLYIQDVTRSLYENLVNGVLNATEYRELNDGYQEELDDLAQRSDELKQMSEDEAHKKIHLQKSLQMLNGLIKSTVLSKEHIDQFIERINVFRDGHVYVEVQNFID